MPITRYAGDSALIQISTSAAGARSALVSMADWEINASRRRTEVTSFQDTNVTKVQHLPEYSASFSGFYDSAEEKVFTGSGSVDGITFRLYPVATLTADYWDGGAWMDYRVAGGTNKAITLSASLDALDNWVKGT